MKKRLLTGKTVTDHETGCTVHHTYVYDTTLRGMLPLEESVTNSDGKVNTVRTVFPYQLTDAVSVAMTSANRLDVPVKKETLCGGTLLTTDHTVYALNSGNYLPYQLKRSESGGTERTLLTYEKYDSTGNPLYATTLDGRKFVFLWAYNNRYPVMMIEGLTYTEVETALGASTISTIATSSYDAAEALYQYRSLLPSDAHVTVYTYYPSVGLRTETSPNRLKKSYSYDGLGRLVTSSDNYGTTEKYEYNYQQ